MVAEINREEFFLKTFNEQMAWITGEVTKILRDNEKYCIKKKIMECGKEAYGEIGGYTHEIKRLFEVIKADPKNREVLCEVKRAEQELIAFLYDDPGALSAKEIYVYWNHYEREHISELIKEIKAQEL